MKADFRKIEIENINGVKEVVDIAKTFGNALYAHGRTLEVVELARAIWKDGEVELNKEQVAIVKEYAPQLLPYVFYTAIINAIK